MTGAHDLPDDDVTRELARALHAEVDHLEVSSDSLARIQARTAAAGGRTAWRWLAPLAAAAVVAVVAAGAVLVPRGGEGTATPPGTTTSPSWSVVSPSGTMPTPTVSGSKAGSPDPSASATSPGGGQPTKSGGSTLKGCIGAGSSGYAYYVSDLNGSGPRLYRGTASISCHLGLEESLSVPVTKDPDFTSAWPAGTRVLSLSVTGSVATVDLSAFPSGDPKVETAAVQQLVWTLTANRPSVTSVRFTVDGAPPQASLDWSKPVRRGNSLATLSNVWILTPHNNAVVGSPVSIRVYGTGFEGQVPIKVFQDGAEVASTAVTTRMGGFAEARTSIELPPGTYEIQAYNDSGQDGSLTLWDTKVFTVQ